MNNAMQVLYPFRDGFPLWQGRPVNTNREAACFIAKLGGNEIHAEICEKWGGWTVREVFV
jgi:hypothetical protein